MRYDLSTAAAAARGAVGFRRRAGPGAHDPAGSPARPCHEAGGASPAPRRAAATATGTLTVNITDGGGLPVQGVDVRASGPLDREGTSLAGGLVRFLNLRGGDYRLRFAHPKFVLLERDVTMRPGASQTIDVMLSPAPDAPEPVAAPAPAASGGEQRAGWRAAHRRGRGFRRERNFISGRDGIKEDPLGCTASAKTTLVQVPRSAQGTSACQMPTR